MAILLHDMKTIAVPHADRPAFRSSAPFTAQHDVVPTDRPAFCSSPLFTIRYALTLCPLNNRIKQWRAAETTNLPLPTSTISRVNLKLHRARCHQNATELKFPHGPRNLSTAPFLRDCAAPYFRQAVRDEQCVTATTGVHTCISSTII